jgi:hypothetical protein
MYRASRSERYDLPSKRKSYRFVDAQSHPADLLYEELAAARGTLVVR